MRNEVFDSTNEDLSHQHPMRLRGVSYLEYINVRKGDIVILLKKK